MKKFSKFAAFAVSLVLASALAIVGCADISSDDGVASEGYKVAGASKVSKALTLNVSSESDLIDFSTSTEKGARTIVPDKVDSTKLKFYLGGENLLDNSTITPIECTFVGIDKSTTEGTITVELEAASYRFTLVAVPKDAELNGTITLTNLISKAYFIGYANADLRYTEEAASVNFVLSSDGLTGNGKMKIKFYLEDWSDTMLASLNSENKLVIDNATIALYDIKTGEEIGGTKLSPAQFSGKTSTSNTVDYYGSNGAEYTDIAVGTYNCLVTFTNKDGQHFYGGDQVRIVANQTTEALCPIRQEIADPPQPPKKFSVGYIAPDYDSSDYYKAVFNWEDDSKNVLYYEIALYDITSSTKITAGQANVKENWPTTNTGVVIYGNSKNNPITKEETKVFYGLKEVSGPNWYAGSLNRGNFQAIFYLELGKRYLARIRGVSEVGNSEWGTTQIAANSYKEEAVGPTSNAEGAIANAANLEHAAYCYPAATTYTANHTAELATMENDESLTAIPFNTEVIGLFRVTYELSGGTIKPSSLKTVYYFDQLVNGNPIMQPDSVRTIKLADGIKNKDSSIYNNNKTITLKYGSGSSAKKWTSWKQNAISGTTYPSDYLACNALTAYNPAETYYVELASGGYARTTLTAAPDPTSGWVDYYTGTLQKYKGCENLVLYANYTSNTFGVKIVNASDYLIQNNLGLKATLTGSGGKTPVIKISSADKLGSTSVDVIKTLYGDVYTPVTVTDEIVADTTGTTTYYTVNDGTDTLATFNGTGSKVPGDIVYTKREVSTPTLTQQKYFIVDRTQVPVTYKVKKLTEKMIKANKQEYFQLVYIKADEAWWNDSNTVPVSGTAKNVYTDAKGTGGIPATEKMKKAATNAFYRAITTQTDNAWWTAKNDDGSYKVVASTDTAPVVVWVEEEAKTKVAVTEGMLKAVRNEYYSSTNTKTNAAFWRTATVTSKIYSNPEATTEATLNQAMIKAARNEYFYISSYEATDYDWWNGVTTANFYYTDSNGAGEANVETDMITAGKGEFYRQNWIATDKAFWTTATVGTTKVYTSNVGADETVVIEDMVVGGKNIFYTKNDGSDVQVTTLTAGNSVYVKELGTTINTEDLKFTIAYNTKAENGVAAFGTYEKVLLELKKQGTEKGTSVGVYSVMGSSFTVPLKTFTSGTYRAILKCYLPNTDNEAPYEYPIDILINN